MTTRQSTRELLEREPLRHYGDRGTRVAYRVIGDGAPLLMIHGFPLHGLTYRKVVADLARDYACIVVDLPGAGESAWGPTTDFSFPAHADRLDGLMGHLEHDRYAVLGHDTGGSVARHLALRARGRVQKLALINTELPNRRPPWIPFYQKLLAVPGSLYGLRVLFRLRGFLHAGPGFAGCFWDDRLIDGEFRELFLDPLARHHRRAVGYAHYLRGFDWAENDQFATLHGQIDCPVALIWGRQDPTFLYEHARDLVGQFPNCAGIESIEQARLLPHEERPEAVCLALRRFLGC